MSDLDTQNNPRRYMFTPSEGDQGIDGNVGTTARQGVVISLTVSCRRQEHILHPLFRGGSSVIQNSCRCYMRLNMSTRQFHTLGFDGLPDGSTNSYWKMSDHRLHSNLWPPSKDAFPICSIVDAALSTLLHSRSRQQMTVLHVSSSRGARGSAIQWNVCT